MSRTLYICSKDKELDDNSLDQLLHTLNNRLIPDNIKPREPKKIVRKREALLIINPNDNTRLVSFSLSQGCITDLPDEWQVPGSKIPDGSFSVIRTNRELTEIVTDPVASYSMWYYFGKDIFLASGSQRAIIHYLKSFEFNDLVIPWMLSSGILGPGHSWDMRLKLIPGHTSIILDKVNWTLKEKRHEFNLTSVMPKRADEFLKKTLYTLFDNIELNMKKWILPLSGGGDSRLLLTLLHKKEGLKTITWGTRQAPLDKQSDAWVAKKVADHYKVPNAYFVLDESDLPPSVIFDRMLIAGEGRTDTIVGYVDGFQLWKHLYESNIQGIIRGDHGFGTRSPVWQTTDGFHWTAIKLLSDYKEFEEFKKFGIPDQQFPVSFNRRSRESLKAWEIRLRQTFRFPYLMSALNDLKNSFVDVYNPLLSRSVIEAVLSCPGYADKMFFKRFNREIGPGFDFATKESTPSIKHIMEEKGFNVYIREYLKQSENQTILDPGLIDYALKGLFRSADQASGGKIRKFLKTNFKFYIPYSLKNKLLMRFTSYSLNHNAMALRIFIMLRMAEILQQDSRSGE